MKSSFHTTESSSRVDTDRFNAASDTIGFVVHRRRPIGWSIRNIANPRFDILALALSGRAHYECDGDHFEATRGTMLYFPRGVRHSAHSDPKAPWSFYSVGFSLNPTDPKSFNKLPHHQKLSNFTQLRDYFDQLNRSWRTREQGFSMVCRAMTLLLMQQYVGAAERDQCRIPHANRIEAIIQQMNANVGHVDPVWVWAKKAGLSESRFRLLFHKLTGCSVTRYQNRLRIQAAQDLLASGHYSVGEVAEELGFRDIYYFSRLFKRFTGMPPSAFSRRGG